MLPQLGAARRSLSTQYSDQSTYRHLRIDFNEPGSGWSTPRRTSNSPRPPLIEDDFPSDLLLKASAPNYHDFDEVGAMEVRLMLCNVGCSSTRWATSHRCPLLGGADKDENGIGTIEEDIFLRQLENTMLNSISLRHLP